MIRICTRCRVPQPLNGFAKNRCAPGGRSLWCRSCRAQYKREWRRTNPERARAQDRRRNLRRKGTSGDYKRLKQYGLSRDAFQFLLRLQRSACAVCQMVFGNTKSLGPHVDHDHSTGRVRGLLCNNCNRALGLLNDSPSVLIAAAEYLGQHGQAAKETA